MESIIFHMSERQSERQKLKVLLGYWMEHNCEHADEFKEWAGKTKTIGDDDISNYLLQAAQEIDQANGWLNRALEKLKSLS